jgi:hypothetical protein
MKMQGPIRLKSLPLEQHLKKMKKFIILLLFFVVACAPFEDCLRVTGNITSKEVLVTPFEQIQVNKGIGLVVSEGPDYQVTIVSGDQLIANISATVSNGVLELSDQNDCNWRRSYGTTTVYVTAPALRKISCQSEQPISSGNTLHFSYLHLSTIGNGTANFYFDVDNDETFIESNNVSGFYITGRTKQLSAAFYEGNGPLYAENLEAKKVYVFHRGSNHMYVKPLEQITGDIWSTGNVYSILKPTQVSVQSHYTGRLIFN